MAEGKVKWFSDGKGYGFIERTDDPNSKDVFVHYSAIKGEGHKTLKEDDIVIFEVTEGQKGLQAQDVEVVGQVVKSK